MKIFTDFFKFKALALVAFLSIATLAEATHFRYMTVNWQITSYTPTTRTVQFNITQSWRKSAFFPLGGSAIGQTFNPVNFMYGDGNGSNLVLTVTSENNSEDWMVGTTTLTHVYNTTSNVTAYVNGCCRISTLGEGQKDQSFIAQTVVTLSDPTNSSPVGNTPPILYVQTGLPAATIQINATDPDNDPLTFSLSTTAESGLSPAVPSIVSSLSPGGLLTLNTIGKAIGSKYATQAKVTDSHGASVPIDFIMQVVGVSNPPVFDYSVTPLDGATIKVQPGTPVLFGVKATDPDPGSSVTLNSSGIPAGAVVSPQTGSNPAQINF